MKILRLQSIGIDVRKWQFFLLGEGYPLSVDGKYGPITERKTKAFQVENGLNPDGVVGHKTYMIAFERGLPFLSDPNDSSETGINWPPKPDFPFLANTKSRQKHFGKFNFEDAGIGDEIRITCNWPSDNIISIHIPAVKHLTGGPKSGNIRFHKRAAPQLQGLFEAWENAGLMDLVETWGGSYYPRYIRGRKPVLSNHSFGTAFDINVAWNGLGHTPALVGQKGSVRKLVPLANKFGFYWGGHFNSRLDGMHFEVARLFPEDRF
ncbi:M15 family metallopeptidase [Rhodonellum sp.]|uniref:M15 family metallopeptidase n=1 Tax=Rhodonellum sp. TaxID=2231180 RepID=UPI00271ADF00|nr:M15 family metallopeptidase [Rhodonellum sp.]MDO9553304.1 M15 family metallopeptidase [Rhodonellum sp.]